MKRAALQIIGMHERDYKLQAAQADARLRFASNLNLQHVLLKLSTIYVSISLKARSCLLMTVAENYLHYLAIIEWEKEENQLQVVECTKWSEIRVIRR